MISLVHFPSFDHLQHPLTSHHSMPHVLAYNIHTCLTALCPGLPDWAGTRKEKPIWILLKQETVNGSSISWAIYKSAPRYRQITMPAPHHSVSTGWMLFLPPNQQRQRTDDTFNVHSHGLHSWADSRIISIVNSGGRQRYHLGSSSVHCRQLWADLLTRHVLLTLLPLLCRLTTHNAYSKPQL